MQYQGQLHTKLYQSIEIASVDAFQVNFDFFQKFEIDHFNHKYSHCLETKLKEKKMGTLQFCLTGILWTYTNNREEQF